MHNDPTRITGPKGAVPRQPGDEMTQVSGDSDGAMVRVTHLDEDGPGAPTVGATPTADWYTAAGQIVPLHRSPWAVTAALVATAAVGFGVVTGVMSMTRSRPSSDSVTTSATTDVSQVEEISATPTRISSAPFPAHSDGHCTPILPDRASASSPARPPSAPSSSDTQARVGDPNVRQDAATNGSCPFLVETKRQVWAHEAERPNESNYSLSVYSDFREDALKSHSGTLRYANAYVLLQCTPRGGITMCRGGDPGLTIYVRRQVH